MKHYHVSLTHTPEHCSAHEEDEGKSSELVDRLENTEDNSGVTVHSAHVTPNEHTFYFLLEPDYIEAVNELFTLQLSNQ